MSTSTPNEILEDELEMLDQETTEIWYQIDDATENEDDALRDALQAKLAKIVERKNVIRKRLALRIQLERLENVSGRSVMHPQSLESIMDEKRIAYLKQSIATQQRNAGWNDAGIYDREWKKVLAATKRELKAAQRKTDRS